MHLYIFKYKYGYTLNKQLRSGEMNSDMQHNSMPFNHIKSNNSIQCQKQQNSMTLNCKKENLSEEKNLQKLMSRIQNKLAELSDSSNEIGLYGQKGELKGQKIQEEEQDISQKLNNSQSHQYKYKQESPLMNRQQLPQHTLHTINKKQTSFPQNKLLNILDLENDSFQNDDLPTHSKTHYFKDQSKIVEQHIASSCSHNSKQASFKMSAKIHELTTHYMKEIQLMQYHINYLESQNEDLRNSNAELKDIVYQHQHIIEKSTTQQQQQLDKKLDSFKKELIEKFAMEAEDQYALHLEELRNIEDSLVEERKKRKHLQEEVKLLTYQKENIVSFYKELVNHQRENLHVDLINNQKELQQNQLHQLNQPEQMYQIGTQRKDKTVYASNQKVKTQGNGQNQSDQKKMQEQSLSHKKYHKVKNSNNSNASMTIFLQKSQEQKKSSRVKSKNSSKNNKMQEKMTKEELIPFLAKGIQDLKNKLGIK